MLFENSLQIPITLKKEEVVDNSGYAVKKCGFKIGGGIDQNYMKSPQGYSDNVSLSTSNTLLQLTIKMLSYNNKYMHNFHFRVSM